MRVLVVHDEHVYAVDASNEMLKWKFKAGSVVYSPPIAGAGGTVYTVLLPRERSCVMSLLRICEV